MKKDALEEFIGQNREEFDIDSPSPEIWNRILQGRKKPLRSRKILNISYKVAAAVAIFMLSYLYHEYRDPLKFRKEKNTIDEQLYAVLPELKETELYYNNVIENKLNELEPLLAGIPGVETELTNDLAELDSMYLSLKKDLLDNVSNEEVLEAMIQNYRIKLEVLEDLLQEIKNEKNPITYENDKVSI